MAGLGPLPATARVVACADAAVWLRGIIMAAMAVTSAGITRRSLARRAVRAMIIAILLFRGCRASVSAAWKGVKGKPLFRLCGGKLLPGIRSVTALLSMSIENKFARAWLAG